jgi:hypothetical protein
MVEEEGGEEEEMTGMVWVGKPGREAKHPSIHREARPVRNAPPICHYLISLRCLEITGDSWRPPADLGTGTWR